MTSIPYELSDPDPTTQLAWPTSSRATDAAEDRPGLSLLAETEASSISKGRASSQNDVKKASDTREVLSDIGRTRLTTAQLFCLSISMAGAQVAWTVELGYGTPFLLSLGLSEQLTSLVWLAGPISGLVAQPIIGAISDSSRSRYRRRYWIITSTVLLCVSTLVLAYCQEISSFFVDILGGGEGSWDPKRHRQVDNTAIGFAVLAFYLLDFSLNALQASLRNLLLDVTPPSQLSSGNAWHGRMTHAGNIVGYGLGFLPLAQLPLLRLLGGSQFRKFCVVVMVILVITVAVTCISQHEKPSEEDFRSKKHSKFEDVLRNIWNAVVNLPKPIRRVCYVQFFAFMGWFPFLFYATTYVGQVMANEAAKEPDNETATRMGNLALLSFSIVAVLAGSFLPQLARRDRSLLDCDDEDDEDVMRLRGTVREWRIEAAKKEKYKLPHMPFMLRNIWTGAMILFTMLTFSTFFVSTLLQAIVIVSLVGICWAVACWVPFAIIMEFLKEMDEISRRGPGRVNATGQSPRIHIRNASSPTEHRWKRDDERQSLLRRRSLGALEGDDRVGIVQPVAGGTVLGIHNLAIVAPQFFVAIVASVIFKIVDSTEDSDNNNTYLGKNGVAWVLRFGGLCTLFGALFARKVPPTKSEREMRWRLGELKMMREQRLP